MSWSWRFVICFLLRGFVRLISRFAGCKVTAIGNFDMRDVASTLGGPDFNHRDSWFSAKGFDSRPPLTETRFRKRAEESAKGQTCCLQRIRCPTS